MKEWLLLQDHKSSSVERPSAALSPNSSTKPMQELITSLRSECAAAQKGRLSDIHGSIMKRYWALLGDPKRKHSHCSNPHKSFESEVRDQLRANVHMLVESTAGRRKSQFMPVPPSATEVHTPTPELRTLYTHPHHKKHHAAQSSSLLPTKFQKPTTSKSSFAGWTSHLLQEAAQDWKPTPTRGHTQIQFQPQLVSEEGLKRENEDSRQRLLSAGSDFCTPFSYASSDFLSLALSGRRHDLKQLIRLKREATEAQAD